MVLNLDLGVNSYDIVIERGSIKKAGELLNLNRKTLIVTDEGVPREYAETVAKASAEPYIITVPEGEGSKSFDTLQILLSKMLSESFTRRDCVVAVGGGVVGDLSGFAASLYMRGIDFYNIPTTVLSQVDSSIGGKTAINFEGIKNNIGAFYQPKKVLIDTDVLRTLPERQISNGLSEAVKMSLTSEKDLFELFEKGDYMENIDLIIEKSLRIKKDVVSKDEKETGLRRILNFGHTIGHGIESLKLGLYHGECVALGMIPMCGGSVRERLIPVLEKLNLPTRLSFDENRVLSAMTHDKKAGGGKICAVFVNEIGSFEMKEQTAEELISLVDCIKEK